ncbi:MAG: exodeoxyribonuclease VII large subunit, partial [Candidatus Micrarchaeota archaeon]
TTLTQRLDELSQRLDLGLGRTAERRDLLLATLGEKLHSLSPLAVLERGYSVTMHGDVRRVVREAGEVRPGEEIHTRLSRGSIRSRVIEVRTDRHR